MSSGVNKFSHIYRWMSDGISGWIDPLIEFKAFIEFVSYAPRYGRLQDRDTVSAMAEAYYKHGGCRDLLHECAALGTSPKAASFCYATGVFCVSVPFPRIRIMLISLSNFSVSADKYRKQGIHGILWFWSQAEGFNRNLSPNFPPELSQLRLGAESHWRRSSLPSFVGPC